MRFPKTLGACVDLAYKMRQQRLELQRKQDEELGKLRSSEEEIKNYIIETFKKVEINSARGEVATASVSVVPMPNVKDWAAFYRYIKKEDAWDLLERRPAKAAYRERVANGEMVPGVETYDHIDLSLTRVGEK